MLFVFEERGVVEWFWWLDEFCEGDVDVDIFEFVFDFVVFDDVGDLFFIVVCWLMG